MKRTIVQWFVAILFCARFLVDSCAATEKPGKFYFPPSISNRGTNAVEEPPGETFTLDDQGVSFSLFLPTSWTAPTSGEESLTLHFHNPDSFALAEHSRRGLKGPLVIAHFGATTPAYQTPFKDKERLARLIKLVEAKLKEKGASEQTRIKTVDISSYGAGYGAVREILESPDYIKIIRRLVMCDSMYASYGKDDTGKSTGIPIRAHIDPWVAFAREAVKGEKTFVLTYSQIAPPGYASTGECASIIINEAGGSIAKMELDSCAAANDLTCALLARGDLGHLHAWGYAGNDLPSRMMHPWHLSDIWKTLDRAGEP